MLRVNIKPRHIFDYVIDMLYSGWVVEDARGDWLTLRLPIPPHPYR